LIIVANLISLWPAPMKLDETTHELVEVVDVPIVALAEPVSQTESQDKPRGEQANEN